MARGKQSYICCPTPSYTYLAHIYRLGQRELSLTWVPLQSAVAQEVCARQQPDHRLGQDVRLLVQQGPEGGCREGYL